MVSQQSKKLGRIPALLLSCMLIIVVLVGCGSKPNPTPPALSNPVPRLLIAIDLEDDTEPAYPYRLGHEVALAFAQKIEELATRVNSYGLVNFACRISSNSWQDCPVSFKTPAIPAWVLPPPVPVCGNDPYACSTLKLKYQKDLAAWKIVHAGQERALEQTRSYVHDQSEKIRHMSLPFDNKGSDIYNALATCAANLQEINTPLKFCILATDFLSTTEQSGSLSGLAGVRVVAAFDTCSSNAFCQQSTAYWSNVVRSAGAVGFTSYSVSQSEALGLQLPDLPA